VYISPVCGARACDNFDDAIYFRLHSAIPEAAVFDDAILRMLSGALVAYATLRRIEIAQVAADFVARRALDNIKSRNRTNQEVYDAAVKAIAALPSFIDKFEREVTTRQLVTASDARSAINALQFPCVYPWCTS
jgi:hypothetical protein